jgi:zinc protease
MEEVREKRGLAYSVYCYLYPLDHAGIVLGGVATENKSVKQSMDVIRQEMKHIAAKGISEEALKNAKSYLTGSYALRLDSSSKLAATLLAIQFENLGIDYIERRQALIEKVTLDDIRRVAKRLIKPDELVVTVVGQPQGLTDTNKGNDSKNVKDSKGGEPANKKKGG